jgi:hypothetical protein
MPNSRISLLSRLLPVVILCMGGLDLLCFTAFALPSVFFVKGATCTSESEHTSQ